MRLRWGQFHLLLNEAAQTVASLPAHVGFYETGNQYSHYLYLLDTTKLPDVEAALLGGISVSDYGGPWGVGSVSAHKGYGPLLYRLAMEWVAENGGGRGLTRNRGGETSPAAKKVWDRFDAVHREPGSKVKADHSADPMWPEYTSHSGELKQVRTREVKLTKEQADLAWDVLTGLNIGDRPGRAERRGWRSAPGGAR